MTHSFNLKRPYAADVFALIAADQVQLVYLTQEEARLRDTLPATLGAGERESIAIAQAWDGMLLSNESRVAHCCRQRNVSCLHEAIKNSLDFGALKCYSNHQGEPGTQGEIGGWQR